MNDGTISERKTDSVLELRGITKVFPGIVALSDVHLDVRKNEVHAIVGENGAGKSTLCNVITGIFPPTHGTIYWKGEAIRITHPSEALSMGIAMVYQERNLIPGLTGAQNISLGMERARVGLIDEAYSRKMAEALRERVGARVPLDVQAGNLGASQQQMIEILRALAHRPQLLILDEPTASLDRNDIECLFQVVRHIREDGTAVIFISHKLDEVYSIADRISVFRDGRRISTTATPELNRGTCIKHMINREMVEQYPKVTSQQGRILLAARDVSDGRTLTNVTLTVKSGEIVGVYGLVGAGRTQFAEVVVGLRRASHGEVRFEGKPLTPRDSPAMRIRRGIFLIPEDRRRKGLFSAFSIRENTSISFLETLRGFFGLIKRKEEKRRVQQVLDSAMLRVTYNNVDQGIEELSGGNKQKVMIGRWIGRTGLRLLIMDEPTQGIDVGAKREVYNMMRELAERQEIGILCISSELPELIGISDRIYVFRDGAVSGELGRAEFNQEEILRRAL
jgi:ribose transport system ATP-binding protein